MTRSSALDTFGGFLRMVRKREQITQRDLGIATGYSESQISRFEQRHRPPDLSTLVGLFVPALSLQDKPGEIARLCELAAIARGEAAQLATNRLPAATAATRHCPNTPERDAAEWAALADGDYLEAARALRKRRRSEGCRRHALRPRRHCSLTAAKSRPH